MSDQLTLLTDVFFKFQGDKIMDFTYDGTTLRLVIESEMAAFLGVDFSIINLVLTNCTSLCYYSYAQTLANREAVTEPGEIFSKGLLIQGVENRNNQEFIVYTNSYLNTIDAGGLHLTASDFQLYDQEFGRIALPVFNKIANKLDRY